jgi:hypothetical protein
MGRLFVSGIVKEGSDGRQPEIAAVGRDPSAFFQIGQKGSDQWGIDLLESQTGGRFVQTTLREPQEQTESVPIGTDRVRTCLPLAHEALSKEFLQ